jgi:hypothetical protein
MGFGLGKVLGKAFEVFKVVAPILLTLTGIGAPFAAMMGGMMGGMGGMMGGMMGMGGGSMMSSLFGSFLSNFGGGAGGFAGEGAMGLLSNFFGSAKSPGDINSILDPLGSLANRPPWMRKSYEDMTAKNLAGMFLC